MPRVSQDHLDERREFILLAAARCFARDGFHASSVADVIAESGLSAGSVYRYFKNKDELIGAVIDQYLSAVQMQSQSATAQSATPHEAVMNTIGVISRQMEANPPSPFASLLPQIWAEALRNPEVLRRVQAAYRAMLDSFAEVVERTQASADATAQPSAQAQVMLSLLLGYIMQTMLFKGELSVPEYVASVQAFQVGLTKRGE